MTLRIDDRRVEARGTLLELCRSEGVDVPTLCFDRRLGSGGHCRACMIEVDGRLQPACSTPARDGMVVQTSSRRVREYRRDLGELMASEAVAGGHASTLLDRWMVDGKRYGAGQERGASRAEDASHPFLRIDRSACILCRLCIDVCADVQGQFVLSAAGRGAGTHVTWGKGSFAATDCAACGACAAVCPSGAITDVDRRSAPDADRIVRTTCAFCGVGCAIDVRVAGDRVVAVDGARSPVNEEHLCVKGRYAHGFVRHPDRLTTPLVRRDGRLVPASWDEAIAAVAAGMMRSDHAVGVLSSSRCTNEENYLVQKWARAGLHTNNVDCCARVCHAPSAAGMRHAFGTGAATNSFDDIERADLLMICGANPTDSHPVVGARIRRAVLRGNASLIVIDPRRTALAAIADVHLQPRPGTNVPLLNAIASVIVEERLYDASFLHARADGFEELTAFLAGYAPEAWQDVTGVPASDVRRAARMYAAARAPMQMHGLGITEHFQGSEAVMLLCNLAVLVGAVGREGVGVNPLRGQNNVQGAADMGCQPDYLTGYAPVASAAERARFERLWECPLPANPGLTLPRMYEAIDDGRIRSMFILGEDVVQSDPDCHRVRERLSRLEFLAVQEIFLSQTAELAHVVLPGASAFEKSGTFTNAERRIQRVRAALQPTGEARADWEILTNLMQACGMYARYGDPRDIFEEVTHAWPALGGATYLDLAAAGLQWPIDASSRTGTPILHRDRFACGKATLACVAYVASPGLDGTEFPLLLMTGRVLEHYNSASMTRRSGLCALAPCDELHMHPADAQDRNIEDGRDVTITSRHGHAHARLRLDEAIRPGTAFLSFHFAETSTNAVVSHVVDRLSDCPEYKVTPVQVCAADG